MKTQKNQSLLISENIVQLTLLKEFLETINDTLYTEKTSIDTIGSHVRHILCCYKETKDYNTTTKDVMGRTYACSIKHIDNAIQYIDVIIIWLENFSHEKLSEKMSGVFRPVMEEETFETNFASRFNEAYTHTVHHHAYIRIIIEENLVNFGDQKILLPERFGRY